MEHRSVWPVSVYPCRFARSFKRVVSATPSMPLGILPIYSCREWRLVTLSEDGNVCAARGELLLPFPFGLTISSPRSLPDLVCQNRVLLQNHLQLFGKRFISTGTTYFAAHLQEILTRTPLVSVTSPAVHDRDMPPVMDSAEMASTFRTTGDGDDDDAHAHQRRRCRLCREKPSSQTIVAHHRHCRQRWRGCCRRFST